MDERLGIGEFARRAGLSISAVRFYGERGLLEPAAVDPATGYRAYDEAQVATGRLIGDLRRLRMSLAQVAAFLAAPAGERPGLVGRHLDALAADLDAARAAARALGDDHRRPEDPMTHVTLPAADLAAGLDQVLPAAGTDPERPVLGCVLVEVREGSLRLVATDRFRLAVRDLVPSAGGDRPFRCLAPAAALRRWRPALPAEGAITLVVSGTDLAVRGDGVDLTCPLVTAEFPAYEAVLDRADGAVPVVVDRDALHAGLCRFAGAPPGDAVLVRAGTGGVTLVRHDQEVAVPARHDGPAADVALDVAYATDAVEAVTGPDVVVEIADALRPVVFRSADDGTFATLVMPVRLG